MNRATVERQLRAQQGLAAAATTGLLPLDIMLARMRGDTSITEAQFQAAVAAAPFCHPKLSAADTTVRSDSTVRVVADEPLSVEQWAATFALPANNAAMGEPPESGREAGD